MKKFWDKIWRGEKVSMSNLYTLSGRVPIFRAVPYGFQHILAMFVANIAPIFIVAGACELSPNETARLIQTAMIIAGVGTLIQIFPIFRVGSGLPVVMGVSFTFVSVFCTVGPKYGYGAVIGAILIGGVIEAALGLLAKYWRKIIAPIVSACVVTAIGFSLLSVGATSFGGGSGSASFGAWQNWTMGGVTLLACILFNIFAKGHWKQLSVLFGLAVGYVLALILHFCLPALGIMDFSAFEGIGVVALPQILPYKPIFKIGAIIPVALIFLVSATETIGDTTALTQVGLGREPTDREISGSLACDGLSSSLSALFGCMPLTSFSQNVGLVSMTKVVNRFAIATGAIIMIFAGVFPVIGAALATLPEAVLGGCTLMMFGSIVVSGLQMVAKCGFSQRNITITALSLSIGIGFTLVPEIFHFFPEAVQSVFADNCVAVVFLVSIVLNLILPKNMEAHTEEKPETQEIQQSQEPQQADEIQAV